MPGFLEYTSLSVRISGCRQHPVSLPNFLTASTRVSAHLCGCRRQVRSFPGPQSMRHPHLGTQRSRYDTWYQALAGIPCDFHSHFTPDSTRSSLSTFFSVTWHRNTNQTPRLFQWVLASPGHFCDLPDLNIWYLRSRFVKTGRERKKKKEWKKKYKYSRGESSGYSDWVWGDWRVFPSHAR